MTTECFTPVVTKSRSDLAVHLLCGPACGVRAPPAERAAGAGPAVPRSGAALNGGASQSSVAKAYRLLEAIMNTAVHDDGIIRWNPSRVRGACQDHSPERPVLTLREVIGLADVIGNRYEALILVAGSAVCGGRVGRAAAPRYRPGPRRPESRAVYDRAAWWRRSL